MKIVLASSNEHKVKEINAIVLQKNIDVEFVLPPKGFDPIEDGKTFEENSFIKAKEAWKISNTWSLADDSGLEIDYLDKAPGVYSARFMGEDTSYEIKNQALIDKLDGVPKEARTARFVCAIGAVLPNKETLVVRETMEGYIGYEIAGENGFGYDPIFYLDAFGCSSAALSREQKNAISHRGKALREIKKQLFS